MAVASGKRLNERIEQTGGGKGSSGRGKERGRKSQRKQQRQVVDFNLHDFKNSKAINIKYSVVEDQLLYVPIWVQTSFYIYLF